MIDRRRFLGGTLAGIAGVSLRRLATGIPFGALAGARVAMAQGAEGQPQTLILCTSQAGDPFNTNAPGCDVPGATVAPDPRLRRVNVNLGGVRARAAQPWASLPPAMRDRLAFVLHRTGANAHPEHAKVMKLYGAAKGPGGNGEDMLVSSIAARTASALGTIQVEPVNMGRPSMTFQGRVLPRVRPTELKDLFAADESALRNLAPARDRLLDALYADLKREGTAPQRDFLDRYARSRAQARQLGEHLGELLQGIPADPEAPDQAEDQVRAAAALASLGVAPAIILTLPFGGDNHNDPELVDEVEQTVASVGALGTLWGELERFGVTDQVTLALWNVFGRTFLTPASQGRNHNAQAHTLMLCGPRVRPGVYGGLARQGGDYGALGIHPRTGEGVARGGIAPEDTLASVGKTLCAAVGLDDAVVDSAVVGGQVIRAVLRDG